MNGIGSRVAGSALIVFAMCAAAQAEEQSNTQQRSFSVGQNASLIVDGINGYVKVTPGSGREVRVNLKEVWKSDDPAKLSQARSEVRVDMSQTGEGVRLYVDGPFRHGRSDGRRGYDFRHEFDITAPADILLKLKMVNGNITTTGIRSQFDVQTVNGGVEMNDAAVGGEAASVNGGITLRFSGNPQQELKVHTVNGSINLEFPSSLAGDFNFSTVNGNAHTDFEFTPTASGAVMKSDGSGMRRLDRPRGSSSFRIGSGGPTHSIKTVNGSLTIKRRG